MTDRCADELLDTGSLIDGFNVNCPPPKAEAYETRPVIRFGKVKTPSIFEVLQGSPDTCLVRYPLSGLEVEGRQHAFIRAHALRFAPPVDGLEHVLQGSVQGKECPTPDPFPFQQLEKARRDGLVVAVAAGLAAHGKESCGLGTEVVHAGERLPDGGLCFLSPKKK